MATSVATQSQHIFPGRYNDQEMLGFFRLLSVRVSHCIQEWEFVGSIAAQIKNAMIQELYMQYALIRLSPKSP